ncbi:MAG: tRNA lysidine(34) synthetase TilS [Christensenellaceae bacterium]
MSFKIDISQIHKGENVAVALSGGKDSVFLLYRLLSLKEKYGFSISAINVEHGIRGKNSEKDTEFCLRLAKSLNVPIKVYRVNATAFSKENGYTLEQGARILRYGCFSDAINSDFCQKVATAHHKNDLCETLLFNLFRGSGLRGAKINSLSYDGKIIRPMLNVSRQEIDIFIAENHLPFVTDETNADNSYSRNYIRNEVLPVITSRFENAVDSIYRFSKSASEDDEFLYKTAQTYLMTEPDGVSVPTNLEKPLLSRATILALNKLGVYKDYTSKHVDAIYALCRNQSGSRADLLNSVYAVKCGDKITFKSTAPTISFHFPYAVKTFETPCGSISIEKVDHADFSGYSPASVSNTLYFDGDKIPSLAEIRTKKDGDVFTKYGGGTKSLKRYLTDKKLYSEQRSVVPLIACDNEILCVVGIAISDKIKITPSTANVMKISFEPKKHV